MQEFFYYSYFGPPFFFFFFFFELFHSQFFHGQKKSPDKKEVKNWAWRIGLCGKNESTYLSVQVCETNLFFFFLGFSMKMMIFGAKK